MSASTLNVNVLRRNNDFYLFRFDVDFILLLRRKKRLQPIIYRETKVTWPQQWRTDLLIACVSSLWINIWKDWWDVVLVRSYRAQPGVYKAFQSIWAFNTFTKSVYLIACKRSPWWMGQLTFSSSGSGCPKPSFLLLNKIKSLSSLDDNDGDEEAMFHVPQVIALYRIFLSASFYLIVL